MATAQYTSLLNSLTTNLDSHLSFFLFIIVLIFIILSPESSGLQIAALISQLKNLVKLDVLISPDFSTFRYLIVELQNKIFCKRTDFLFQSVNLEQQAMFMWKFTHALEIGVTVLTTELVSQKFSQEVDADLRKLLISFDTFNLVKCFHVFIIDFRC